METFSLIALLLDAGADVYVSDRNGQTPVHEASEKGRVDAVGALMRAGANANATGYNG